MNSALRLILAAFDFKLAAPRDNAQHLQQLIAHARDGHQADVVIFPELALSGGLVQDMLRDTVFLTQCQDALYDIACTTHGIVALIGWPEATHGGVRNALSVLRDGRIDMTWHKTVLSTSGTRSESHWICAAPEDTVPCVFEVNGMRIGLLLGQDLVAEAPLQRIKTAGAELLVVPTAWPFEHGELVRRKTFLAERAVDAGLSIACINTLGGQDALVFDGISLLVNGKGQVHPVTTAFCEHWQIADYLPVQRAFVSQPDPAHADLSHNALLWRALTRSIADYCRHNGFSKVWLGLSGGLDSALVLALAVDALGADKVTAVRLPSRYTTQLSNDLAQLQCDTLGVRLLTLHIERPFQGFIETLAETFAGLPVDATEENLQARVRGSLLMALANKCGGLLLSTGNKSECAVGYATIYGDMCGGYAPISDVYKSEVFALAKWRNAQAPVAVIPPEVIARPPSAELRPDQRDQDSLPPYEVLDAILYRLIECDQSITEITAAGFDAATVERVQRLVRGSEWKRQQAALGPKVSVRALGVDWCYPISRGD